MISGAHLNKKEIGNTLVRCGLDQHTAPQNTFDHDMQIYWLIQVLSQLDCRIPNLVSANHP